MTNPNRDFPYGLACEALLFINMSMSTSDIHDQFESLSDVQNSSMTRALSILLLIGQVMFAFFLVMLVIMIGLMAFPSEFRDTMLATSEANLDPNALLGRCLAAVIVVTGWFFVLRILRKVVIAIMHGDPFQLANIKRLRQIWLIMAATEFFHALAKFWLSPETGNMFEVNIGTWFFIFVIAAISEAFRHGAALRAEQELTI